VCVCVCVCVCVTVCVLGACVCVNLAVIGLQKLGIGIKALLLSLISSDQLLFLRA
jgi:hypothetical protein